jgi:hypothetical protein
MQAIVLAVPITPHVPACEGISHKRLDAELQDLHTVGASSSLMADISSMSIVPARYLAQLLRQSVQAPTLVPLCEPGIIGPVTNCTIGLLAEMPPIN